MEKYETDSFNSYKQMVSHYPCLSQDEMFKLFEQYHNGDNDAKEKIFNANLRLVVSIAKRMFNYRQVNHLDFLDLIQEGNLKLLKAIETYDSQKGAFSTYATAIIERELQRTIDNTDDVIRQPVHLKKLIRRYYYLTKHAKEEGYELTKEDICTNLEITENSYNYLCYALQTSTISLNTNVSEDDDSELDEFIIDEDDDYIELINRFDDNRLIGVLKLLLSPLEYYIIYYHILADEQVTLSKLAKTINISRERARQIASTALETIRSYMQDEDLYKKTIQNNIDSFGNINVKPITPEQIIIYLFIKKALSPEEIALYEYLYFTKNVYSQDLLANKLNITKKQLANLESKLNAKISMASKSKQYQFFKQRILAKYKASIYTKDFIKEELIIDYEYLRSKYLHLSYAEIMELFSEADIPINFHNQENLQKMLKFRKAKTIITENLEKKLNILLLGYNTKSHFLPPKILYPVYRKHQNVFTEEEKSYLEYHFFGTAKDCPNKIADYKYYLLISKLERLYYHLDQSLFDKEKYLEVRKKYYEKLDDNQIQLLDLYYGFSGEVHSISDLANMYNISYSSMYNQLKSAIEYAKKLYIQSTSELRINKELYLPYLDNNQCHLPNDSLELMQYYLANNLTYEQISKKTGLTKKQIIYMISKAIDKIDYYRFQIITQDFDINKFKLFLAQNRHKYSSAQLQAIVLKYLYAYNNEKIAKELDIDSKTLNSLFSKVNQEFISFQIKDIILNSNDIINEYNLHPSESVLTLKDRAFIKYLYLDQLSIEEILEKLNITKPKFYRLKDAVLDKIKAHKIGIIKPDLLFFTRDEMQEILKDSNLPINEKDKEMISYLFELNGFPFKSLWELSTIFNASIETLRKNYYEAIITIKKYQNNEIEKAISFQNEIQPLLKYFCPFEQNIIIDYYQNKLTHNQISQKYNLKSRAAIDIINEIKFNLYCLINNTSKHQFDFDYYQKVCQNDDLPFYGDKTLAIQIFNLYYGMDGQNRLSMPQIIQKLHLNLQPSTLYYILNDFILSIYKYRDGIRKEKTFSYQEIENYYNKHKDSMIPYNKAAYEHYLQNSNNKGVNATSVHINDTILFDMIKAYDSSYICIANLSKNDILSLIQQYEKLMPEDMKRQLIHFSTIDERESMKQYEIDQVFILLNALDLKLKFKGVEISNRCNIRKKTTC